MTKKGPNVDNDDDITMTTITMALDYNGIVVTLIMSTLITKTLITMTFFLQLSTFTPLADSPPPRYNELQLP